MTRRSDRVHIVDMLVHAAKAVEMAGVVDRVEFERNEMMQLAVTRLLEIVGEAANRVSEAFRKRHPGIPWHQMIGTRNRLAHGYDDIDLEIVWDIVRNDLPPLIDRLEVLVEEGA